MLSLDRAHKSHLEHLNKFNAEVTAEFCKLAVQSLLVGDLSRNEKLYAKAASRLQVREFSIRMFETAAHEHNLLPSNPRNAVFEKLTEVRRRCPSPTDNSHSSLDTNLEFSLQSDTEIVNESIEALVALFKLAARRNLSKLQDSLVLTQLSQTHVDIIAESYTEVRRLILFMHGLLLGVLTFWNRVD